MIMRCKTMEDSSVQDEDCKLGYVYSGTGLAMCSGRNLFNTDTLGPVKCVLIREVSFQGVNE